MNIVNQNPYLRTSRNFPEDIKQLTVEVNRTYIDIANFVNARVIGIFPTTRPSVGGEAWFISGNKKQQNLRQVYTFTAVGNIPHGITTSDVPYFTPQSYGSFTDGTNWYGAIFASNVAIAGQVSFYITPTDIVVIAGAGAPAITKGLIVLEWLSNAIDSVLK